MTEVQSGQGLERHGIKNVSSVRWNLPSPTLYEEAVRRREGVIAHLGPLVVRTGHYTGRSPTDKFIVHEPSSASRVWWGPSNRPMAPEKFRPLHERLLSYLQGRDVFVQDCFVGADALYRVPIRVITEAAWHSLFARNMFIRGTPTATRMHGPQIVIIAAPHFHSDPELDGTNSEAFVVLDFGQNAIFIGGTNYAGELKKAVFSILNYELPKRGVLPMHCSANQGRRGDVAIFFGLSGTGKTTLSSTSDRALIGDDEHGWSDQGVFNFEGGCYAKVIRLSAEAEPEIYVATRRFGTILENVAIDSETRRLNLDDDSLTENTRASYPISYLPNIVRSGVGDHPRNVVMLTADAFGVLPPIAKLTPQQATYYFLAGYTAKVAGTERGITDPKATFSACFGAPFMALDPIVYAHMLDEKINQHKVQVWLVNTGWSGGPYGVGQRIKIGYTRAMLRAALAGALDSVPYNREPAFGLLTPSVCPDIPPEILDPRTTWEDGEAYDEQARKLSRMFADNFQQYAGRVSKEIEEAGPPPEPLKV
jgi:phosphoenolpyruvate carboxykinase (ATP)